MVFSLSLSLFVSLSLSPFVSLSVSLSLSLSLMAMGSHEDFGTKEAICGESFGKHSHAHGYALKPMRLKSIKTAAVHRCELV